MTNVVTTDKAHDDFVIFVGGWLNVAPIGGANGHGHAVGTFNIYAEYGDFLTKAQCDHENTGDPGTPANPNDDTRPD